MLYRLSTGAQSEWKKKLFSGLLIFAVTAGFPVLGAWLNYENLSLRPTPVVQDEPARAVLGESTTAPNPAGPPIPDSASRSVPVTSVPRSSTLRVRHQPAASAAPPVVPAPTPTTPATLETTIVPPVSTDPAPEDLNVIQAVEDIITVDPGEVVPPVGL